MNIFRLWKIGSRQLASRISLAVLFVVSFYPAYLWPAGKFVIGGGDIIPLVNPLKWLAYVPYLWNTNELLSSGIGGPDSAPAAGIHFLLQAMLQLFGLTDHWRALILVGLLNLACALALYYLLSRLVPHLHPYWRLIGSVFYILNASLFFSSSSFYGYWLLFVLPLLLALLINLLQPRRGPWPAVIFILAGNLLGPLSVNPPTLVFVILFLTVFGAAYFFFVLPRPAWWAVLKRILLAVPVFIGCNLWWIFANINVFLFLNLNPGNLQATTDLASWDWTSRNADLLNIFWLQTSWAWDERNVAYWSYFQNGLLSFLIFVPFILVLLSFFNSRVRRQRIFWVLLLVLVGAAIIANGQNEPFGNFNQFVLNFMPLGWLFREPVRFVAVLSLVFAVMIPFGLEYLFEKIRSIFEQRRFWGVAVRSAVLGFILLALAVTAYPLWSGRANSQKIGNRTVSNFVELPDFLRDYADAVNSNQDGRNLLLPAQESYQSDFGWGYHGLDPLVGMVYRPIVRAATQSYISGSLSWEKNLQTILSSDLGSESVSALGYLGINQVSWRGDIEISEPVRAAWDRQMQIGEICSGDREDFGPIYLCHLPVASSTPLVSAADQIYLVDDQAAEISVAAELLERPAPINSAFINEADLSEERLDTLAVSCEIGTARWEAVSQFYGQALAGWENQAEGLKRGKAEAASSLDAQVVLPKTAQYKVYLNAYQSAADDQKASPDQELDISIDGVSLSVPAHDLSKSFGSRRLVTEKYLPAGEHAISITPKNVDSGFILSGLDFTVQPDPLFSGPESETNPTVTFNQVSPTEIKVSVRQASRPFLLKLAQAYNPFWKISIDGVGADQPPVPHLELDGYANGWYLDRTGDYDLTLKYSLQDYFRGAIIISLAISLFAIIYGLVRSKKL